MTKVKDLTGARSVGSGRVLLVEDDQHVRRLSRLVLEDAGYVVDESVDGEDAIRNLRERSYDAIVLDLMLPKIDGFSLLDHLDDLPLQANAPVVIITARADPAGALRSIAAGASDLVRKPFSPSDLTTAVDRAISGVGVDDRRGTLWRAAQVYDAASSLQSIASANGSREESKRTRRAH